MYTWQSSLLLLLLLLPAAADVEFFSNRKAVNALNITRRAL